MAKLVEEFMIEAFSDGQSAKKIHDLNQDIKDDWFVADQIAINFTGDRKQLEKLIGLLNDLYYSDSFRQS